MSNDWNTSGDTSRTAAFASGMAGALGLGVVSAALGVAPTARWIEPVGAAAHLALLPFAAATPAPTWGRAMGYAWLAIDTATSIARMNGLPADAAMRARLGGHVVASAWIASAAIQSESPWTRLLGLGAAAALGGHSLVAPLTKRPVLLMASGPLLVGWLLAATLGGGRSSKDDIGRSSTND